MLCAPVVTQQIGILTKEKERSLLTAYCVPGTSLGAGSGCLE